ncbi:MAG: histidine phosphatase family protein [Rhizobiaceae bacterium]
MSPDRPLVYVIRHGQTDWNVEGRLQGQADTPINQRGRNQAAENGRRLALAIGSPADFHFVASPLWRTRETMELLRQGMGLTAGGYATDPALMEVHFGDWQGATLSEVEAHAPGSIAARGADKWTFRPPGDAAESYAMLCERVRPWFEAIDRPTVCVTHGGVMRCLFAMHGTPGETAASLDIPQDKVLRWQGGRLFWM